LLDVPVNLLSPIPVHAKIHKWVWKNVEKSTKKVEKPL